MSSSDTARPDAQVHFGVFFQGVNHTTIWSDPASGSQIDFETFRRVVTTAERGLFDAFFLGEGLRLREQDGKILDLDIAGRPDAIAQLAALAGITEHIGLVATQNTTYNEPADLARRLAGLDVLSGGRAGWNAVTTDNAWTGENFRRGGYLDHALRYERAAQFIRAARAIWDSWADDAIATSPDSAAWVESNAVRHLELSTSQFDISLDATLPRSAQVHPVIFQAGDSSTGRDFAAANADVIFSRHGTHFDEALAFANDIRARLVTAGRPADDIKILPGTQIVLAEKSLGGGGEASLGARRSVHRTDRVVPRWSGMGARSVRPRPGRPPPRRRSGTCADLGDPRRGQGRQGSDRDRQGMAGAGRGQEPVAPRRSPSRRQPRSGFVGTPGQVADELARWVRAGATDGFNISPYLVPGGLDEIVDWLVPELQERGVYRTEYTSTTLRGHLGLREPLTRRQSDQTDTSATG